MMTKVQKDHLFILIKSLSKSEKRQFKLYVGRLGVNDRSKFLMLFNTLEKMPIYHEATIFKKGVVKKRQLSNLKSHLYKQILISLRLNPAHQTISVQIREQLDFATILYNKGLYKQSLKLLDKAKALAIANEETELAYTIVEFEKSIESQYITRRLGNRSEDLSIQSKVLIEQNLLASKLSNLSLQLYGLFLKTGYVKNDAESKRITTFFNDRLPNYDINTLGFKEKLRLYNAHLWYHFLILDFLSCYKYATKWVALFYGNTSKIALNPVSFLRGNHYLLEALFYLRHYEKFKTSLSVLESTTREGWFPKNDNLEGLTFLYVYSNKLNLHFIEGRFKEGLPLIDQVLKGLERYRDSIDAHHVMLFYYKVACLYFGAGKNKNCILFLDKIIHNKTLQMREDLLCFSRILNLVAHYEAGIDYHLERLIKSTYAFLIKMEDLYEVQKEFIRFLKSLGTIYPNDVRSAFVTLHKKLKDYEKDPYQSRAFLYLDIISWLESKIKNESIARIIQEKFNTSKVVH